LGVVIEDIVVGDVEKHVEDGDVKVGEIENGEVCV